MKATTIVTVIAALGWGGGCGGSSGPSGDPPSIDASAPLRDASNDAAADAGDVPDDAADVPDDAADVPDDAQLADGAVVDAARQPDASADVACERIHSISVPGDAMYLSEVGIDANGDAIVLWRQGGHNTNNGFGGVHGGHLDGATGWSNVIYFEHGGGAYPSISLALEPSGNAFVVWQDSFHSDDHQIWTSRYVGGNWAAVAALPTETPPDVHGAPGVVTDGSGNGIVSWRAENEDGLRLTRFSANAWQPSELLDVDTFGSHLAIGPGGVVVAILSHFVDDVWSVRASRYTPGAGWSAPVTIGEDGFNGQIALDSAGNAIATWTGVNAPGVWAARYSVANGGWSAPVNLDVGHSPGNLSRMAVATSGHAVVAWTNRVMTDDGRVSMRVVAATFDPASGWSAAMHPTANPADGVDVGIAADGHALVAWHEGPIEADLHIHARRFTPGTGWGQAFRLISAPSSHPRIAVNATGDAVVAWTTYVGNGDALHACAFR